MESTNSSPIWHNMKLPPEVREMLDAAPKVSFATSIEELISLATCDAVDGWHEVAYDVPDKGRVVEAKVCRVKNGIAANYMEPYMRRRDPECMVIGDSLASDKKRFEERFGQSFDGLRDETFEWLKGQELAAFAFTAGSEEKGFPALAICPANAGFFAMGLALLQGILPFDQAAYGFNPSAIIFVAPPFRHTHFDGKQVVVHDRSNECHAVFSYNLYPGPSAKKGVYGMLINFGEKEGWVTAHCSTVMVITPYDNYVVIMHEGASGGGKSEMLEQLHREPDGRLIVGVNTVTGDKRYMTLPRGCELRPVTDDMALCHFEPDSGKRKLDLSDAEDAWFVRVDHILEYGTDPHLEKMTVQPRESLLFLNIDVVPESTALIWDHIEDEPGVRCPNPRVIIPRRSVPGIIDDVVTVDIRSFGVRTPPCTREKPTYGIIGLFHILPPALAWLWRLAAPRGHDNPSIVQEGQTLSSEGVGSYWPFATGRRVDQANLLLEQIISTPDTLFVLCPNQHIGAWKVGFMPEWLCREYLARRGYSMFRPEQLVPSRCSLLGYSPHAIHIEGTIIGNWFLRVDAQPEVGPEAYDEGAAMLRSFFDEQVVQYLDPDLMRIGKIIIDCCLSGGTVEDFAALSKAGI